MSPDLQKRAERLRAQAEAGPTVTEAQLQKKSRRSFLTGAAATVLGLGAWRRVQGSTADDGIPGIVRRGLEFNEDVTSALSSGGRKVPEWPRSRTTDLRANGPIGIRTEVDLASYRLRIEGPDGDTLDELVMDDIMALNQIDMVTEFKCIEGWAEIAHWTGPRLSELAETYADAGVMDVKYVGMETPDGEYYVGLRRDHALHSQSLLAHSLDGSPLNQAHGAPLRLAIPTAYGVKNLKRVGVIRFTDERPADYWAERGYSWDLRH